jgi:hypothetical protein
MYQIRYRKAAGSSFYDIVVPAGRLQRGGGAALHYSPPQYCVLILKRQNSIKMLNPNIGDHSVFT